MAEPACTPSRRGLITGALALATTGALPAVARTPAALERARPVVSFHMDQPFLDMTGRGQPFAPPSAAGVHLPEAVFSHHPYL